MVKSEYKEFYIQEIIKLYNNDQSRFIEALNKLRDKEIVILTSQYIKKSKNNLEHLIKESLKKEKLMSIVILYSDIIEAMSITMKGTPYISN